MLSIAAKRGMAYDLRDGITMPKNCRCGDEIAKEDIFGMGMGKGG
jgi:hypothetical protein